MLLTLSDLKSELQISTSDTSDDVRLQRIVNGVDKAVRRYLKRKIERYEDEVEYHSGTGRQRLYLRNRPVVSVSHVYLDDRGYGGQGVGAFAAATEIDVGVDWILEDNSENERNQGCLISLRGEWPEGIQNIKVVYTHGYEFVPADLKLGCLQVAMGVRSAIEHGGPLQSEDLGDYSYQLMAGASSGGSSADLRHAMHMLRPFREVAV